MLFRSEREREREGGREGGEERRGEERRGDKEIWRYKGDVEIGRLGDWEMGIKLCFFFEMATTIFTRLNQMAFA